MKGRGCDSCVWARMSDELDMIAKDVYVVMTLCQFKWL